MTQNRNTNEAAPRTRDLRTGVTAVGRNNETLSRTRKGGIDQYHFDPAIVPEGWEYQWNSVSVLGNGDVVRSQMMQMQANGWAPVQAERHDGVFMPKGYKGEIVIGGCRLEERPSILCEEARLEDRANAAQLLSDRNESLKVAGVNKNLPAGFDPLRGAQRRVLGQGGDNIRMSIDASLDHMIPKPGHTIAGPDDA
jgi:hypothetical protein